MADSMQGFLLLAIAISQLAGLACAQRLNGMARVPVGALEKMLEGFLMTKISQEFGGSIPSSLRPNVTLFDPGTPVWTTEDQPELVLRCHTDEPKQNIAWFKNGSPVVNTPRIQFNSSGHLILKNVSRVHHGGEYHCRAETNHGTLQSVNIKLNIIVPNELETMPRSTRVRKGGSAILQCRYLSHDFPQPRKTVLGWDVRWYTSDQRLVERKDFAFPFREFFFIENIQESAGYFCEVYHSDTLLFRSSTALVTVDNNAPQEFVAISTAIVLRPKTEVTYLCVANFPVQNIEVEGIPRHVALSQHQVQGIAIFHVPFLKFSMPVRCKSFDGSTAVRTNTILVNLEDDLETRDPVLIRRHLFFADDSLSCKVQTMDRPFTLKWYFNGLLLPQLSYEHDGSSFLRLPAVKLPNITKEDAGIYQCQIQNSLSAARYEVHLEVIPNAGPYVSEPRNLRVLSSTPNSITVAWESPLINRYYVYTWLITWRPLDKSSEGSSQLLVTDSLQFEITNLLPYQTYRIYVQAITSQRGAGPPSQEVVTTTLGTPPQLAPENIQVLYKPDGIHVSWSQIRTHPEYPAVRDYVISYRAVNGDHQGEVKAEGRLKVVITDIRKNLAYGVSVAGVNVFGRGPSSYVVIVTTVDKNRKPSLGPTEANKHDSKAPEESSLESKIGMIIGFSIALLFVLLFVLVLLWKCTSFGAWVLFCCLSCRKQRPLVEKQNEGLLPKMGLPNKEVATAAPGPFHSEKAVPVKLLDGQSMRLKENLYIVPAGSESSSAESELLGSDGSSGKIMVEMDKNHPQDHTTKSTLPV